MLQTLVTAVWQLLLLLLSNWFSQCKYWMFSATNRFVTFVTGLWAGCIDVHL